MAVHTNLLSEWMKRCRESQMGHYESSKIFNVVYYSINIPAILMTSLLGTYSSIKSDTFLINANIITIFLFISSALIALQTFLKPSNRAMKHKISAMKYGSIRREIEILLVKEKINDSQIANLKAKIDNVSADSPNIPKIVWKRIENRKTKPSA